MTTITIITIVVVALLTLAIFSLSWIAYSSCIKAFRVEVENGKHDEEIKREHLSKKKRKGRRALGLIGSCAVLLSLLAMFGTGIAYKACNENFSIDNKVALVVKSGSMSDFYNEEVAEKYDNDRSLQFCVGDICIFECVSPEDALVVGQVYGYDHKGVTITHRLISIEDGGLCRFRGDNNPNYDGIVKREQVEYHYLGEKVEGVGALVLYAQSYFGIWSLSSIVCVFASSEVVWHKVSKIAKARESEIFVEGQEPQEVGFEGEPKPQDGSKEEPEEALQEQGKEEEANEEQSPVVPD